MSNPHPLPAPQPEVGDVSELVRVGNVLSTLAEETRLVDLDEAARERLVAIHRAAVDTIRENVSAELGEELTEFVPPIGAGTPSEAELRIAQSSLTGWLSGLFAGLQAAYAGRALARQLEPGGQAPPGLPDAATRAGQYL